MASVLRLTDVDLERARLKMKRKIAITLISAMMETDCDYAFIAKRLNDDPAKIEQWITGLISGDTKCAEEFCDLLLAMKCEASFSLRQYHEPIRPNTEPEPT